MSEVLTMVAQFGKSPTIQIYWLFSAMLVFLMNIGFTLLETGCVRRRNMWGIAVKNFCIFLAASFSFSVFGYRLMYPANAGTLLGFMPLDQAVPEGVWAYIFYMTGFACVSATIVSGAIAERTILCRSNGRYIR